MANDNATRLAQHIVEDFKGNAYYEDRQVLGGLISGHLAPTAHQEAGAELADAILADRRGANYYADPKILAEFLQGSGVH